MSAELLQLLNGVQTMSIVGMCKNAGKTTMLNWMLHHDRLQGTLGLTSIGRDGESTDVVTGTEKPGIFVREGTLIATAKDMLRLGDTTLEIMETAMSSWPGRPSPHSSRRSPGCSSRWGPTSPSSTALWAASLWAHGLWRRGSSSAPGPHTT